MGYLEELLVLAMGVAILILPDIIQKATVRKILSAVGWNALATGYVMTLLLLVLNDKADLAARFSYYRPIVYGLVILGVLRGGFHIADLYKEYKEYKRFKKGGIGGQQAQESQTERKQAEENQAEREQIEEKQAGRKQAEESQAEKTQIEKEQDAAKTPLPSPAENRRQEQQTLRERYASRGLTPREIEVAVLAHNGLTNAQIAEDLYISVTTVKKHMTHIMEKLGVGGRGEV